MTALLDHPCQPRRRHGLRQQPHIGAITTLPTTEQRNGSSRQSRCCERQKQERLRIRWSLSWRLESLVLVLLLLLSSTSHKKGTTRTVLALFGSSGKPIPVKIFILAGESNMEGRAHISQLREFAVNGTREILQQQQKTATHANPSQAKFAHLIDPYTLQWKIPPNVYCVYEHDRHVDWWTGPCTVEPSFGANRTTLFGPEVEMAHVLSNYYAHTGGDVVVLLKTAWEQKTLGKDFRPPRAGGITGFYWYRLQSNYKRLINTGLETILPAGRKYETPQLAGIVWWHGYADIFHPGHYAEYESNLQSLLLDWRDTFETPHLPIVLGELGGSGHDHPNSKEVEIRRIQHTVAHLPQFNRTTKYIPTAHYVHTERPRLDIKTHYCGRADTMIDIGAAFALGLLELIDELKDVRSGQEREADTEAKMGRGQAVYFVLLGIVGVAGYYYLKRKRDNDSSSRGWMGRRDQGPVSGIMDDGVDVIGGGIEPQQRGGAAGRRRRGNREPAEAAGVELT